jgi:hypothetical protein
MAWATKADARNYWPDAVNMPDAILDGLLAVAEEQAVAYAPALAVGATVPTRYMLAVIYQAREVYAASQRGEQDVIGVGDYAIRARPMTGAVKRLLRPVKGKPVMG